MEALRLGMRLGADAIELDVRQSRDGALFVIHDPTLDRTTDATGTIFEIDATAVREATQANGEPVPELVKVLEAFPGVEITIDVKDAAAVPRVVGWVRRLDRVADTILYAEHGTTESAFREYEGRRATSTGQALRMARDPGRLEAGRSPDAPEVVHTPLQVEGTTIVTADFVRRVHDSGRTIQVWTIDEPEVARDLVALGVDGIITNDVRALRALVDGDECHGGAG